MTSVKKNNPTRSIFILLLISIFVKLLGFARETVLAATYGASNISDAFIIAFAIPVLFLSFISGSAASAYIPMYHRVEKKNDFTNNMMTCLAIIGLVFSLVFTIFPQALTRLFASQLEGDAFSMAVYFVRMMVWSAIPILLSDILRSYLQIQGLFFWATISTMLINFMIIPGILASGRSGNPVFIGVAPVVGSVSCMLFLLGACYKNGYTYRPFLDLRAPEFRKTLVVMAPMFLSNAIGELNQMIDRNFASSLMAGSISSLNYASKVAGLFNALIGYAFYTALFPRMSVQAANNDMDSLKRDITRCTMSIAVILLPAMIGVIVLADPLVRILFERGSFTLEDTLRTAQCLRMYALMIVSSSVNALLLRAFFAMGDTKTPALLSGFSVLLDIVLNILLIGPLAHRGLALSTSISAILMTALLLLFLQRSVGPLGLRREGKELGKIALASCVMGIAAWTGAQMLPLMSVGMWRCLLYCGLLAGCSALLYGGLLALLGNKQIREVVRVLQR